jgi:tryptophanyl-tRNA synthetase
MKKILLTGDRPTGPLHLGHFVGSLENRVKLQSQFESYILIADIQAYTDNFKYPEKVKANILEVLADYLAVGIDPNISNIFLQSHVRELFELTQYFSNLVSFDYLKHNPTLKTELEQRKINNLGFISYPVSQAADILAFKAEIVPVGEDQSPILELTNKVSKQFNELYNVKMFPRVQGLYTPISRLTGIDGNKKMSKSLDNAIFLKDSMDEIKKKVNKMYTDPLHLKVEDPGHLDGNVVFYFLDVFDPDKENLLKMKEHYEKGGLADSVAKKRLLEVLENLLNPIRTKREEVSSDKEFLLKVLKEGTEKAQAKAESTLKEVREIFQLKL